MGKIEDAIKQILDDLRDVAEADVVHTPATYYAERYGGMHGAQTPDWITKECKEEVALAKANLAALDELAGKGQATDQQLNSLACEIRNEATKDYVSDSRVMRRAINQIIYDLGLMQAVDPASHHYPRKPKTVRIGGVEYYAEA